MGFVLRPGAAPLGWGLNGNGQLGGGVFGSVLTPTATLFPPVSELVSGTTHTCSLRDTDRRMVCAGDGNQYGTRRIELTPVLVDGPPFRALSLVAGVDDSGGLWRWGLNWYGVSGSPIGSPPALDPSAPANLTALTSDGARLCALDATSRVRCDASFPSRELGAPREALGPVTQIWSGSDDVLARPADPTLPVVGVDDVPSTVLTVSTSGSHTCYADTSGALWCMGEDDEGQLGQGSTSASRPATRVLLDEPVQYVSVGESWLGAGLVGEVGFSSASSETRTWWWGEMDGAGLRRTTPTVLAALEGRRVVDLEAGGAHACAVVDGGDLHCWGRNHRGQLGAAEEAGFGPHLVPLPDVVDVDLGHTHTCALTSNGQVYCFGDNQGFQFAPVDVAWSVTPLRINLPAQADRLVVGYQAACARLVGGEVWCWGDGGYGTNATATVEDIYTPRRIAELTGAEALAASAQSEGTGFCGRFADGALRCIDRGAARTEPWMLMPSP
jgi:hypothetical protein